MPRFKFFRRSLGSLLARVALAIVLVTLVAGGFYVAYLDRVVTKQFEGRRWTLPAQVFAAPLELYVGLPMSAEEIEQELRRLQYKLVDRITRPGTYTKKGARFDVGLRAARFADEGRPAQLLTIVADSRQIESLRDANGREVPVIRLEPMLIGSIFPVHGEDRIVVTPEEVPPLLPKALKAVEDRKFDSHHGVDPEAIMRAMWVNLRSGQIEQGGSTLTQQLVKSYFLDSRQTLSRKLREAVMAVALEARFSKADIMNAYINEIHLGQDGRRAIHGFGLASQFYFAKPLAELDLEEIALLVAVARGPSYYNPRRNPKRALERRNLVLQVMADLDVIRPEEAKRAAARPLGVTSRSAGTYYPAYLDFVRRTLRRDYREEDLTEAGLRIFTNLDPRVQDHAESLLERELMRLDRLGKEKDGRLEGAVVVTSPQSGDVIAIVGSRQAAFSGFNRALDAKRPIGSLVKPFVYLAAIESGRYNAASIVEDAPVQIRIARGRTWRPENFTRRTYGPVPLVRALADSLNLATVSLGMDVGLPKVIDVLERFGHEGKVEQVPSILLGAVDMTPLEVAQVYGGLASSGFRAPLRAVRAVINPDGTPLRAFPIDIEPVAAPDNVLQVNQMMEQVMLRGTARASRAVLRPGLTVVGKSGTSSDQRDSWFAGFSGSHLAVVWVGYDDNRPTRFTGSAGALAVWSRLMADIGTTPWIPPSPETLNSIWIEYTTGLRVEPGCVSALPNETILISVRPGTEPPYKAGCGAPGLEMTSSPGGTAFERAGAWLRDIIQ